MVESPRVTSFEANLARCQCLGCVNCKVARMNSGRMREVFAGNAAARLKIKNFSGLKARLYENKNGHFMATWCKVFANPKMPVFSPASWMTDSILDRVGGMSISGCSKFEPSGE